MTDKFLAQVPINGFELEGGAQHCLNLDFKWLSRELKKGKAMKHEEIMSQINITEDGLVIYVKNKKQQQKISQIN